MRKQQDETAQEPKGEALSKWEKLALPKEQLVQVKGGNGGSNETPPDDQGVNGHEDIINL